jgi:hypothetical protein
LLISFLELHLERDFVHDPNFSAGSNVDPMTTCHRQDAAIWLPNNVILAWAVHTAI